jgi:hypothetical protein
MDCARRRVKRFYEAVSSPMKYGAMFASVCGFSDVPIR